MSKKTCILCNAPIKDMFKFIEDDKKRCPACNSELTEDIDFVDTFGEEKKDKLRRNFYEM